MARIDVKALSEKEIQTIHDTTQSILRHTGVMVNHDAVLKRLDGAGARVDYQRKTARFPENLVMDSIQSAGKKYTLYGRDRDLLARFGWGELVMMSTPGQFGWVDHRTNGLRRATGQDTRDAIRLGDALQNITIVGAMAQPAEILESYREVWLTGELVKGTGKPTRTWVYNGKTARYVLDIYRTVAGGEAALREYPMVEAFLEPISPLQLSEEGLDVLIELVGAGQPVSVGPMAMTSGTAPATLAGTMAQENAEILAGIVVSQVLAPGTPVTYGGIPHIMDPRTSICSFGSPEQLLMAVAMVQLGQFYGFPVYINVGLTDAKIVDAQAGIEKGTTLMLGVLAGADTFGHAGICGADHGASLAWLVLDNELMEYVKRVAKGFEVTEETLASDVVHAVGPRGSYLAEDHTVEHFRKEIWLPGSVWTRQTWDLWSEEGRQSMADRVRDEVEHVLATRAVTPLEGALAREVDLIVECAKRELG